MILLSFQKNAGLKNRLIEKQIGLQWYYRPNLKGEILQM